VLLVLHHLLRDLTLEKITRTNRVTKKKKKNEEEEEEEP